MTTERVRYPIQLRDRRTMISLDKILSDLLAVKLGIKPGTRQSHSAARKQLEAFIVHDRGRDGHQLEHYITQRAILFISDNILSNRYWDLTIC